MNATNYMAGDGSPVVFGKRYGYTQDQDGISNAVIGKVVRLTERGATMEVESRTQAVYHYEAKPTEVGQKTVNVKCIKLWPVQ